MDNNTIQPVDGQAILANKNAITFAMAAAAAPRSKKKKKGYDEDEKPPTPDFLYATHITDSRLKSGEPVFGSLGDVLHEWKNGYWNPVDQKLGEKMAWAWLSEFAPDKVTARLATACVSAASLAVEPIPAREFHEDKVLLPVKNGYLLVRKQTDDDLSDGQEWVCELIEPDQKYGLTYQIQCDYDPFAESPGFNKFIREVLPNDEVRQYVQEYIGYTLIPDCRFQVAQIWLGPKGSNGKSTLAQIVKALHEKAAAMRLNALDGFQLGGILGASLAYVDECPSRINEQQFKILISGGWIQIEQKHRDPISAQIWAKWIINANTLFSSSDQTGGLWRRMDIIPFNQHFPPETCDYKLGDRIVANELSGVLNWAIEGLLRLMKRGRFPVKPQAVQDMIKEGKRETNNVVAWSTDCEIRRLTEEEVIDDTRKMKWISRTLLYSEYCHYCSKNGSSQVGAEKFWKRLEDVLSTKLPPTYWRQRDKTRVRVAPIFIGMPLPDGPCILQRRDNKSEDY